MLHERLLSMYDEHHCEKAAGNHIESQATVDTVDTYIQTENCINSDDLAALLAKLLVVAQNAQQLIIYQQYLLSAGK